MIFFMDYSVIFKRELKKVKNKLTSCAKIENNPFSVLLLAIPNYKLPHFYLKLVGECPKSVVFLSTATDRVPNIACLIVLLFEGGLLSSTY